MSWREKRVKPDDAMADGRRAFLGYVRRELYGPAGGRDELLHDPPHRRYLIGTLYPQQTGTDEVGEEEVQDGGEGSVGEDLADDPVTLAHEWMPSSIGLSFFMQTAGDLDVDVWGARYVLEPEGKARRWRRVNFADADDPVSASIAPPM